MPVWFYYLCDLSIEMAKILNSGLQLGNDFPLVCDTCLGENPYLRMTKLPHFDTCKITKRPFSVFQWRPDRRSSQWKKTLICYEIAVEKNICQCCLNDLTFNVPSALRDAFVKSQGGAHGLGSEEFVPKSETNQAYFFQQKLQNKDNLLFIKDNKENDDLPVASGNFLSLAQKHVENQTKIVEDAIEAHNDAIMNKFKRKRNLNDESLLENAPEDETITTLFLSNLPDGTTEEEIKEFLEDFGVIVRIYMLVEKNSCFVEFERRDEADRAAFNLQRYSNFKDKRIKVSWAFQHDPYHERGQKRQEISDTLMNHPKQKKVGDSIGVDAKREYSLFNDQAHTNPSEDEVIFEINIENEKVPQAILEVSPEKWISCMTPTKSKLANNTMASRQSPNIFRITQKDLQLDANSLDDLD